MLTNNTTYKYETPYKVPFMITWCCANGTVTLQCGPTQIRQPYTFDTNIEDNIIEKYVRRCQYMITSNIPLYYILNIENKVYNRMSTETLTLISIGREIAFFMTNSFSSQRAAPYVTR